MILGGTPLYLQMLERDKNLMQNVENQRFEINNFCKRERIPKLTGELKKPLGLFIATTI